MRKIIFLVLAMMLVVGMFTGCSSEVENAILPLVHMKVKVKVMQVQWLLV